MFSTGGSIVGAYAALTRPDSEDVLGYWFAAVFFGVYALTTLALLWRGGNSLTLTGEGFQWIEILLRVRISWEHASGFEALDGSIDGSRLPNLQVRFRVDYPGAALPDPDGFVPDRYGLKAAELAWLINEWRAKALAGRKRD